MDKHRSNLISIAGLLALMFAMFGDVLFAGGTHVLSDRGADLPLQYYSWRDFGFGELAKGHLALWNPYIFGGAPFFGGMQSALLYPLNWPFLFLQLPLAINWTIALNIFLIGTFMFLWMRVRDLSPVASFFAGTVVMFSGPHFLHVFAGHLPQMATMTWVPLTFCAIDGFLSSRKSGWCLLGMFAVAMQIFAGFPQYVFYCGIIAAIYSLLRLINEWNWKSAAGLLLIYAGGVALAAVQLLAGIAATGETVRGARVPFEFAAQIGLPPENLFTFLVPTFFGNPASYWGRAYLWETSLFVTVTGLVLALYATVVVDRKTKAIPLIVIFLALLLALGAHTPLFRFLYNYAPGFGHFRATAKFIFPASLFIVLLAATALDRLQSQRGSKFFCGVFIGAALLAAFGVWIANANSLPTLMRWMQNSGETYLRPQLYADPDFVARAQHHAATSIFIAAATLAIVGTLIALRRFDSRISYGIAALAVVEAFMFARNARPTFDSEIIVNAQEKSFLDGHSGDYRILNQSNPNTAMSLRVQDIWGYDPNVVRRYAEFITWTQGGDPNEATLYVRFTHFDPLYAMLRLRYVFGQRGDEWQTAEAPVSSMPHLQLISNYRVIGGHKMWEWSPSYRDEIFAAMRSEDFDPNQEVILESEPDPKPVPNEMAGTARIVNQSSNQLTIEADVNQPSILLITDVYTPAWRAVALPGSVQSKYNVMPANYCLRAVPLAAGHHELRVEYAPRGFEIGKWISIVTSLFFVLAVVWSRRRKA